MDQNGNPIGARDPRRIPLIYHTVGEQQCTACGCWTRVLTGTLWGDWLCVDCIRLQSAGLELPRNLPPDRGTPPA